MALPSSGSISLNQIATEFGGSAPHSVSEYYRGGGRVPSTTTEVVTPSSTSSSTSNTGRGSGYTTSPNWPGSGNIMNFTEWADNGATGAVNTSQVVNRTGTYHLRCTGFQSQGDPGLQQTHTVSVNGTQANTVTHTQSGSSTENPSTTLEFSASAGDTVTTVCSWGSRGWASGQQILYEDDGSNAFTVNTNTGVPTSGVITLEDFYRSSA